LPNGTNTQVDELDGILIQKAKDTFSGICKEDEFQASTNHQLKYSDHHTLPQVQVGIVDHVNIQSFQFQL
jgi:hypothetical protein